MKIIFLDIDGVLNSSRYFQERTSKDMDIDVTRLPLLKRLIDETEASIVLSSSWRIGWADQYSERMEFCKKLTDIFDQYDIHIMSTTIRSQTGERADEVKEWLDSHNDVESFILLDDDHFKWEKYGYEKYWVKTSWYGGLGITEEDVDKGIKILNTMKG